MKSMKDMKRKENKLTKKILDYAIELYRSLGAELFKSTTEIKSYLL